MLDISEKSKKNEILDAYYDLLKKVQNTKEESHQYTQVKQQEEDVVVRAAQFDVENIITTLSHVKIMATQNLGFLEKKLTEEYNRLSELQSAIHIESKNLEEVHQIKINADSLAALLLAQKERKASAEEDMKSIKEAFEQEMDTMRTAWKLERERHAQGLNEQSAQLKKERIRDEEEYNYKIMVERKKDADLYETLKNALDRELLEKKELFEKEYYSREAALKNAEDELIQLRTRVATFPTQLEHAIKDTEEKIAQHLQREHRYAMDLHTAQIEGDKKLHQQIITSLQNKIKEQDAIIRDLNQKSETATQQVQAIALKALDSASNSFRIEREEIKNIQRS